MGPFYCIFFRLNLIMYYRLPSIIITIVCLYTKPLSVLDTNTLGRCLRRLKVFSESTCLCIYTLSRWLSWTYCVSSLCQVLQEVACGLQEVSHLQQSGKEALYVQSCICLFVLPAFPACLPFPQGWGSRNRLRASPLRSHCLQVVESRFPAWLSGSLS